MKISNTCILALAATAQAGWLDGLWNHITGFLGDHHLTIGDVLGNPHLPPGVSYVASASAYGTFTTAIVPTIPTPTPHKPKPVANDTTSTSDDAKRHPNLPNGPHHRGNWDGDEYNINTDVETDWPNTGKTVKYTLTLMNVTLSPQGVPKQMITFNGQYPGPLIEANWGDWLEITVINGLKDNGTSIHWHGFRQWRNAPEDGVSGITECPLAPGDSKVYRFQATSYGSTWYHSHFGVQYVDGAVGPLVVHGPASANYDIDLGPVVISDYYDKGAWANLWSASRFGPPKPSNYLINGKNMQIDGSSGKRAKFQFTPGKKHLLRLINTSADSSWKVQVDGHKMIVIQTDFVAIQPYVTSELSIAIGQRYDVIIEANQAPGNYWLRAMNPSACSSNANNGQGNIANAIVSYDNCPKPASLPTSSLTVPHDDSCVDEPYASLVPIVPQSVDQGAFQSVVGTQNVSIKTVTTNNDTVFQWMLGGISQSMNWTNPSLLQSVGGNNDFTVQNHAVTLNSADTWTYWVIQNLFFVPHPMHLHGHDFSLLGQGNGQFNPSTDMSKLNFDNPPRRDVAWLTAQGWTVIAFKTDNPGPWLMHCHIAWHSAGGLSLQFLERPNDIPGLYGKKVNGNSYQSVCKNWKKYSKTMAYGGGTAALKKRDEEMQMEMPKGAINAIALRGEEEEGGVEKRERVNVAQYIKVHPGRVRRHI